jgi:isoleucyl-tRNA synthetase
VVVLHTALTETLRDEGLAREILSRVQGLRKDIQLGFTDRISLAIDGSDRVKRVVEIARTDITSEALVNVFEVGSGSFRGERRELVVDGEALVLTIARSA